MGEQVEIARDLVPGAAVIGMLFNPANVGNAPQKQDVEVAGAESGIKIVATGISVETDLDPAFKAFAKARVQAVIVARDATLGSAAPRIAELAIAAQLPTITGDEQWVEGGELVSYGVDLLANQRRAAYFVDRILKGAKPDDLPPHGRFRTPRRKHLLMKDLQLLRR